MNPSTPLFTSRQLSVVIAEDDLLLRNILKRLLQNLGYRVAGVACNGLEAVEMTRSLTPDFLILDIAMPEMNGLDAAQQILEDREIPILICTGSSKREHRERAMQMGIGALLVKPFSVDQLKAALQLLRLDRLNVSPAVC